MVVDSVWCGSFFPFLQFTGSLRHFGVGLSVEGATDESSSIHQLWQVNALRIMQRVGGVKVGNRRNQLFVNEL